jgi:hypothetical protein
MSEMTFAVLDDRRAIRAQRHASFVDVLIPALSDDPETIEELAHAMRRFLAPEDEDEPLAGWSAGDCDEPCDAGICIVDLAARLIVYQSTYCEFLRRGQVTFDETHGDEDESARWIPYHISDEWLVTDQLDGWRGGSRQRREEQRARAPFDTREVLYGNVIEFIVDECFAARGGATDSQGRWTPPAGWQWRALPERGRRGSLLDGANSPAGTRSPADNQPLCVDDAAAEIHARWLMTPRDDLRGQTPRDVLHARHRDLSLHLQDRETQWSRFGQPPPPLWRESIAYRYGGYGAHEIVVYYYLVRHLIHECWDMVQPPPGRTPLTKAAAVERLSAAKQDWLHTPDLEDYRGKTPAYVIECERLRLPWVLSGAEAMVDEDCPLCQMLADSGPGFWHLDGCNMDEEFPFALFEATREEWEEKQQHWAELQAKFHRDQQARAAAGQDEDPHWPDELGDEGTMEEELPF